MLEKRLVDIFKETSVRIRTRLALRKYCISMILHVSCREQEIDKITCGPKH